MSQITFERVQELESDLKRATAWADMRTEEVARLETRLAALGESPAAIERAKTTPRVRALIDEYANRDAGQSGGATIGDLAPEAIAALRAVVDLHQPAPPPSDGSWCVPCSAGDHVESWPCPNRRAIATALEAK